MEKKTIQVVIDGDTYEDLEALNASEGRRSISNTAYALIKEALKARRKVAK